MEYIDRFLVLSHIIAGAIVLISGLLAMLAAKTKKFHRQIGRLYFWGMSWIFISALLIVCFFRFNLFLLLIGVFSFYLSFSGYRVLKRKTAASESWVDWFAAIATTLAGLAFIVFGLWSLFIYKNTVLMILCTFFGLFTAQSGITDIKIFRKKEIDDKLWWFYHHMQSMLGSYIAGLTAFLVQMAPNILSPEYSWLAWLLPSIVGTPLIIFWIRYYRLKFKQT